MIKNLKNLEQEKNVRRIIIREKGGGRVKKDYLLIFFLRCASRFVYVEG